MQPFLFFKETDSKKKPQEIRVTPKKKVRRDSSDSAFSSGCGGTPVGFFHDIFVRENSNLFFWKSRINEKSSPVYLALVSP